MTPGKIGTAEKAQALIDLFWVASHLKAITMEKLEAGIEARPKTLQIYDWKTLERINPKTVKKGIADTEISPFSLIARHLRSIKEVLQSQ